MKVVASVFSTDIPYLSKNAYKKMLILSRIV